MHLPCSIAAACHNGRQDVCILCPESYARSSWTCCARFQLQQQQHGEYAEASIAGTLP